MSDVDVIASPLALSATPTAKASVLPSANAMPRVAPGIFAALSAESSLACTRTSIGADAVAGVWAGRREDVLAGRIAASITRDASERFIGEVSVFTLRRAN